MPSNQYWKWKQLYESNWPGLKAKKGFNMICIPPCCLSSKLPSFDLKCAFFTTYKLSSIWPQRSLSCGFNQDGTGSAVQTSPRIVQIFSFPSEMPLQVLPLRVRAMSKVVIEKLDYKEHLVGNTRRELVDLDKLPGRFWVTNTKVVVERFKEKGRKVHRFICTSTIRVSLTVKILKSLMMHEFKKELKSINLSYSMLDFLASKTDFVIEEISGRKRAWAVKGDQFASWPAKSRCHWQPGAQRHLCLGWRAGAGKEVFEACSVFRAAWSSSATCGTLSALTVRTMRSGNLFSRTL